MGPTCVLFTRIAQLELTAGGALREEELGLGGREADTLGELEVREMIRKAKKTTSMVEGDIFPYLYNIADLSLAVTPVFNSIIKRRKWPKLWRVETVTVILKKKNPDSLSDCRNISCTNFLSKVMEGFILSRLREEIEADPDQYGGVKGTGVEHLLLQVWERILGGLEIPEVAITMLGIDYQKAFNRMCHNQCLTQLAKLGASQFCIDVIYSFLSGRCMQTRIGTRMSSTRPVASGSPQGSILGCFLYCVTTQQLGRGMMDLNRRGEAEVEDTTACNTNTIYAANK